MFNLVGKILCQLGLHNFVGPTKRYSVYSYSRVCVRKGCRAKLINNKRIVYED